MRALREEMRQRLLQVPEYRALVSLDRSINELCDILQDAMPQQPAAVRIRCNRSPRRRRRRCSPPRLRRLMPPIAAEVAQARAGGIASAFAETLAAKMDQRNLARASAVYAPPTHRALGA